MSHINRKKTRISPHVFLLSSFFNIAFPHVIFYLTLLSQKVVSYPAQYEGETRNARTAGKPRLR
jgi:hypothetical protein